MNVSFIRTLWLLRIGITSGIGLITAIVVVGLFLYPTLLSQDGAMIYLGLYAIIAIAYLVFAWLFARPRSAADVYALRKGLLWGSILSILWLVEIISGNFGPPQMSIINVLYFSATGIAFTLPLLAGFLAAQQTGHIKTSALVGLWAGLINGLFACLVLSMLGLLFNTALQHDPQTRQEFARSGTASIDAFIFGDFLAGAVNHLWLIGPVLGTLTGTVGGLIGVQFTRQHAPRGLS